MLIAARGEERTDLAAYRGSPAAAPALAALMTVFLLSLAGIPPTAGFIAKVGVFGAAIDGRGWPGSRSWASSRAWRRPSSTCA